MRIRDVTRLKVKGGNFPLPRPPHPFSLFPPNPPPLPFLLPSCQGDKRGGNRCPPPEAEVRGITPWKMFGFLHCRRRVLAHFSKKIICCGFIGLRNIQENIKMQAIAQVLYRQWVAHGVSLLHGVACMINVYIYLSA